MKKWIISMLIVIGLQNVATANLLIVINPNLNVTAEFIMDYLTVAYPETEFETFIYVGIERQKMYYFENGSLAKVYDVSTATNGAGSLTGSEKTPTGLHIIKGKYGAGVPKGGIFVSKRFTGKVADIQTEKMDLESDDITSRVITIAGKEKGLNKGYPYDTYSRHIYIHGTAEEGLIGTPASHGCIRMKNDDVMELFDLVQKGIHIIILDN
ncbi:MAG: lipoprotein-anchoring transpeptidase ErfK/SrfK [Parvicella sp.]|jgi:lipoprotein-anchoring transpeptidase ErfK/SrfK